MESLQKFSLLRERTNKKRLIFIIVALFLFLIALGGGAAGYYFYAQYQKTQTFLANPEEATKREVKELLTKMSKFVELPTGEEPNVATVIDKEKLRGQPFFERAENGDKVILYTQAKRAILYRPKTNKVIDITMLTIGSGASVLGISADTRVVIYNGTKTNGLAQVAEKRLEEKMPNIDVVAKATANNKYKNSLIIVLGEKYKEIGLEIAKFIKGDIAELPEGEKKPDADVLVILGEKYTSNN